MLLIFRPNVKTKTENGIYSTKNKVLLIYALKLRRFLKCLNIYIHKLGGPWFSVKQI